MKWVLAIACVMAVAAAAGSYADFGAGLDANNRGEPGVAATRFSRALAAGDLAETYVPAALLGRARAELRLRHCEDAIRDLDAAIALRPTLVEALMMRASAHGCVGKPEAVKADLDAAIAAAPSTTRYAARAGFHW